MLLTPARLAVLTALAAAACSPARAPDAPVTAATHTWFPITTGVHALGTITASAEELTCESCHAPSSASFTDFTCTGCHAHEKQISDRLHLGTPDYDFSSSACYACHPTGESTVPPFTHQRITSSCATCHAASMGFAALPVAGFTHPEIGLTDCGACHATTA